MRSFSVAAVATSIVIFSQIASAADLPRKAPAAPPPPPPIYNWTGFYLGINGGYGWTGTSDVIVSDPFNALGPGAGTGDPNIFTFDNNAKGGLFGFHVGYNWQFAPNWVVGVEGDFDFANIKGDSFVSPIPYPSDPRTGSSISTDFRIKDLASVRGRFGYATPQWLAYVTGGGAWSRFEVNGNMQCPAAAGACGTAVQANGEVSGDRWGWVVGAGADFRLFASNWLLGAEYLYYRFDGDDRVVVPVVPFSFGTCPAANAPCVGVSTGDYDIHTVRARLSYKF